ncbi:RDD domain containing protein [Catenulispora acidiphila DSM 44928]|uniref:RDD domain containing protein n=2 Tax=Catenulispora TaxID=414878 RepID=C7Q9R6_CATAD|nr:RDD domain containing protein [Catenulispora acidiphila DSM 44928]
MFKAALKTERVAERETARSTVDSMTSSDYSGQRFGLPQTGPGSMASVGRRLAAIMIDWAIAYGVAYLLVGDRLLRNGQFAALSVLAVFYLVGLSISGSTLGMAALGMRVTSDQGGRASLYSIGMRTVLLFLVIPAVVWDADGRGLHDRIAHTMIVSTR